MSTATATLDTYQSPDSPLPGMRQFGLIAAVLGVVLTLAGVLLGGEHAMDRFFQAYLVAYTFWMGVVLGSLALLMVQHLSGGVWGIVLRRPLEEVVRTLPFMAVLFLPIAFGMHSIYEWTHDSAATDPIISQKAAYLNTPFFLAYGLVKGAFLATEAAGSLAVYLTKALVFRSFGALPVEAIAKGLIIGSSLMAGSFLAKRFVLRLDAEHFRLLMDGLLLLSGLTMLWAAFA